jgi:predicted acetyltransferase
MKGYSRRVMENSLRWMRREGFDTSMLYGILNFYPKFGFAAAFPGLAWSLAVRDAERVPAREFGITDYKSEHLAAVLKIFHANNLDRTGPMRRDPKTWQPFRKGSAWGVKTVCKVALSENGDVAGYVVYDNQPLAATIIEMSYRTPEVFGALLRLVARLAWEQRLERIKLILPEDDLFVAFCKPLGLRLEATFRSDGGAMVRMINLVSALKSVAAELGGRMVRSGALNLHTNLDAVGLEWSGEGLAIRAPLKGAETARMPQWVLAQLLYGYLNATALAAQGVLQGSDKALSLLDEMFPARPHFAYTVDEF